MSDLPDPADAMTVGARVHGLVEGASAEIVEVTHVGTGAYVRFKGPLGLTETRMLSAEALADVVLADACGPTLDADPEEFLLAVEALRVRHAHTLNPLLAVSSSNVEPLPHQVQAVYDHLLRDHPQRFLLADDPGAGKTVMAGLYIKEAMARGWVRRCLIVVPGSLAEQWQDELSEKFGLWFDVFDTSLLQGHEDDDDPLLHAPLLIVRLDQFSRNRRLMDLVSGSSYDLAVLDEAHKLTARMWGSKLIKSKRYEFAERLRDLCPNLLLMTATPHNGKEAEFQLFLGLLRDAGHETYVGDATAAGLMRRLVKEQLVHLDGSRLFPERRASTVAYRLSAREHDLYDDVSTYVREEMNKVSDEEQKRTVGFALLVLQRRLASSPEAILRSLSRRRDRLRDEAQRIRTADERLAASLAASLGLGIAQEDVDELSSADAEAFEDDSSSVATASRTIEELETEILHLDRLVRKAEAVRAANVDAKWEALRGLLTSEQMYDEDGARRKIIIFTEHRDTLDYLEQRLSDLLPPSAGIVVIHGAVSRTDRRLAQVRLTQEPSTSILLATDAAGEGVNLQVAHLMVNYDIPWNPNRLEQRFGRIHRIGQRRICHLWNLVAVDTREGDVFHTLLGKLEVQREALGDQVFDVLGQVLTDASLGQLLTRALDGADAGEIESALGRVSSDLEQAVRERTASVSTLTPEELAVLRRDMDLARASSFQPDVIRDFTLAALSRLRGEIRPIGDGWRVDHVPERVRNALGSPLPTRYDEVVFAQTGSTPLSMVPAELLAPGHPLVSALTESVLALHGASLTRGIVLADDRSCVDYTLVWVASDDGSVACLRMWPGLESEPVDPALFTSLTVGASLDPIVDDGVVAATAMAVEAASSLATVVALAHVRGVAEPSVAAVWRAARAGLVAEPGAVVALPGQGWDALIDGEFIRAVPTGACEALRRAERHTAANIGERYRTVVVPGQ